MTALEQAALPSATQEELLNSEWQQCLSGDSPSQNRWKKVDHGILEWREGGLLLLNHGAEWAAACWEACKSEELKRLGNFVIGVTISGKASAAGLSFGPYKDFLTPLESPSEKRRLQLEVDTAARTWTFRVDGRLTARCWWDSAVRGVEDLLNGILTFKARSANQVLFENFTLHQFASPCRVSVIMTCHRFQQRLRVTLRNWCHQNMPSGAFEILVVNPHSPDGTHELMASTARSFSHIRICEVSVPAESGKNKGVMINAALRASRGEWIWLTDADCVFPPECLNTVLSQIQGRSDRLFYGQRRYLSEVQTDNLLAGRLDSLRDFPALAAAADGRATENAPWGYTQIVHQSVVKHLGYCEHLNHFAHCDNIFVQECRRRRVQPEQVPGLFCLHLHHPFAWYGTDVFL